MIKKLKKVSSYALLLGLGLIVLSACKKDEPSPKAVPVVPTKKPALSANVVQKQMSSVTVSGSAQFDFKKKKDPFKPLVSTEPVAKAVQPKVSVAVDLLPIQSYEVAKFKLSGIVIGLNEKKALVVDPAGKGYVVKEGMAIGKDNGRITKITASSLEVVENYRDDGGHLRKRKIELSLAKKK